MIDIGIEKWHFHDVCGGFWMPNCGQFWHISSKNSNWTFKNHNSFRILENLKCVKILWNFRTLLLRNIEFQTNCTYICQNLLRIYWTKFYKIVHCAYHSRHHPQFLMIENFIVDFFRDMKKDESYSLNLWFSRIMK